MTDQEEARGFLDSVSEAGSDESDPLIASSLAPSRPKSPLARHVFALLSFLGFANVYAMRVNLSVAIVAMVNQTAISHNRSSDNSSSCPVLGNSTQEVTDGPFDVGRFLRLSCEQHGLEVPDWARKWINVRKAFANFYRWSGHTPGSQSKGRVHLILLRNIMSISCGWRSLESIKLIEELTEWSI